MNGLRSTPSARSAGALFSNQRSSVRNLRTDIPAKAGIQSVAAIAPMDVTQCMAWIPAFAGMTDLFRECSA